MYLYLKNFQPVKEAALLKASTLKHPHTFSIPIEYWQSYARRWTTEATLTVSRSKTKLHLDFNGLQNKTLLNANEAKGRHQQRVTFFFYHLVVEHSDPISRNFLAILSGGGQILRHRIAFYSEADGNFATVLFKKLGAQIIIRKLVSPPFQIHSFMPNPWTEYCRKKLLHENERDLLNEQVTRLRRESVAIGEVLENSNQTELSNTGKFLFIKKYNGIRLLLYF